MGLHVDVSHLTQEECHQIVCVIARDISLRKLEQERIRKLRKDFDDLRKSITLKSSKRRSFDSNCQICGKILINLCCLFSSGERCLACEHLACSRCRKVLKDATDEQTYLCFLCVKKRELKRKCFDWFYDAVALRCKRFGSAKVLRGFYRCQMADSRVVNLLATARQMTLPTAVQTTRSRSASAIKPASGYLGFRSTSPTTSSISESDSCESRHMVKSKSIDDMGQLSSGSYKSQKPRPSRKISAPAMLNTHNVSEKELSVQLLGTTLEEKARDSSGNSEFEVIPDDVIEQLRKDTSPKESSLPVKIFGEVEFVMMASIALALAAFLSFLACVGYIDVLLTDSEEEDSKEN